MFPNTTRRRAGALLIPLSLLLLQACGNGTTDDGAETTELSIALTDAAGDFNQYTVDVERITLYKDNGAVVETLPNSTRLDFTRYVEVSEFLTTATVPAGTYRRAEVTLDFGDAEVTVEDEDGNSIEASVEDAAGNPAGEITVSVVINAERGFSLRPGAPAALLLDFDLEASNEVEIDGDDAVVTVNPVLLASTDIDIDEQRRLRGLLAGVDLAGESFAIRVRPFRIRHRDFGRVTAFTDAATLFEVDGVVYRQQEGLEALTQLDRPAAVIALGEFRPRQRRFLAREVYAGDSVPWGDSDVVSGSVIARDGATLTVIGATVEFGDGRFRFNDAVDILLGPNTRVIKQGDDSGGLGIDQVSVGQRVAVIGEMQDDTTLDASDGLLRMLYSRVSGLVASVSPLEVELQHVNRRLVGRYDFSGTGIDPANDADPLQYQIDNGALSLASLGTDQPVRINGFPTPFGTAPLDFSAKTIVDLSELPTKMLMAYGADGSASAVQSLDQGGLLLDLDSATGRHHLKQAGVLTDIADLPAVPLIVPGDGDGVFAISAGRAVRVYLGWDAWQAALNERLDTGARVVFVIATGSYDAADPTLTTRRLVARITE